MHKKWVFFHQFVLKILSANEVLMTTKGHNSVVNLQKMTDNTPNLELIQVNAYAIFDQIPFILSQDFERKHNFDNSQGPQLCCKVGKLTRNNPNLDLVNINTTYKISSKSNNSFSKYYAETKF